MTLVWITTTRSCCCFSCLLKLRTSPRAAQQVPTVRLYWRDEELRFRITGYAGINSRDLGIERRQTWSKVTRSWSWELYVCKYVCAECKNDEAERQEINAALRLQAWLQLRRRAARSAANSLRQDRSWGGGEVGSTSGSAERATETLKTARDPPSASECFITSCLTFDLWTDVEFSLSPLGTSSRSPANRLRLQLLSAGCSDRSIAGIGICKASRLVLMFGIAQPFPPPSFICRSFEVSKLFNLRLMESSGSSSAERRRRWSPPVRATAAGTLRNV